MDGVSLLGFRLTLLLCLLCGVPCLSNKPLLDLDDERNSSLPEPSLDIQEFLSTPDNLLALMEFRSDTDIRSTELADVRE
mmetsp:Transcript_59986/g.99684  ORF Transcript_59986/g.99684 Transcript_59986/m.99684 type:complete len:80 (+) Transcript_59986:43-282(+)